MKKTIADKMLKAAAGIINAKDPLLVGDPDTPANEFVGLKKRYLKPDGRIG